MAEVIATPDSSMDNIQKALVSVLGIAGLIAMLVPSENPIAPAPASADEAAQPTSEDTANQAELQSPAAAPLPQSSAMPDESFQMGQPSIDGKPIQPDFGMPYGESASNPSQISSESNGSDGNGPMISEGSGQMPSMAPQPAIEN